MSHDLVHLMEPDGMTVELAILVIGMFVGFVWASVKLRSAATMFTTMLMSVVFVASIITNLSFVWFWMSVILSSFALFISISIASGGVR